jgi:formate--tetrahydrofolate ligase
VELCETDNSSFNRVYELNENNVDKIEKICKRCYGASGVEFSEEAQKKLEKYKDLNYYICMAKTPISLTDNDKILIIKEPFKIHVKDIILANGAKFIIVMTGNIFRMPGLPKIPEANNM